MILEPKEILLASIMRIWCNKLLGLWLEITGKYLPAINEISNFVVDVGYRFQHGRNSLCFVITYSDDMTIGGFFYNTCLERSYERESDMNLCRWSRSEVDGLYQSLEIWVMGTMIHIAEYRNSGDEKINYMKKIEEVWSPELIRLQLAIGNDWYVLVTDKSWSICTFEVGESPMPYFVLNWLSYKIWGL